MLKITDEFLEQIQDVIYMQLLTEAKTNQTVSLLTSSRIIVSYRIMTQKQKQKKFFVFFPYFLQLPNLYISLAPGVLASRPKSV